MSCTLRSAVIASLILFGAAAAQAQGLYWEQKTNAFGKDRDTKVFAMPKMIKVVQDDGQQMILRSDKEQLIMVDPGKKTFKVMKFSELEAMAKSAQNQMQAAMTKAQEQMKNMSPEQRAMLEKMMQQVPNAADKTAQVSVQKTAETKSISGFNSTKYVATENGKTVMTAWTTQDVKEFAKLRDDWVALQRRFGKLNRSVASAAEAYAKIDGFPMVTELSEIKTLVTKVEPRNISADVFEAPAGFTQEQPPSPAGSK